MGGTGAYTLSDVDRANFKAQGFVVLSNVVEPEALRNEANTRIALEKVLSPALRSDHSCIYEVCPSTLLSETECTDLLAYLNARRAFGLSNAKVILYVCKVLSGLVKDLLDDGSEEDTSILKLLNEQYIIKRANGGRPTSFDWHQDSSEMPRDHQEYVSVWVALDDCGEDNGTLYVRDQQIHGKSTASPAATEIGVPLLCNAGDVVVLSSSVWHRSGPNLSGSPRRAYMPQYMLCTTEPITTRVALNLQISPFVADCDSLKTLI